MTKTSNNPSTQVLLTWLDAIISNLEHLKQDHIYVTSNVLHQMFNTSNPTTKIEQKGIFVRTMKKLITNNSRSQFIEASNSEVFKNMNNTYARCSYFKFQSDQIHKSDMQSDMLYPAVVTDINDNRAHFITMATTVSTSPAIRASSATILHPTTPVTATKTTTDLSLHLHNQDPLNLLNRMPLITPTHIPNKFPKLSLLQITPDFDSEENVSKIEALLDELVSLHKTHKKEMNFTSRNGQPGLVIAIPKAKNYETYEKNERINRWIRKILEYLKLHSDEKNSDKVCTWLLKVMYKNYPATFVKSAVDFGLHTVQKMSSLEAAAMWIEANVSFKQARIILRHLHLKFGYNVQVPFNRIESLGDVTSQLLPTFDEFIYRKMDEKNDKVGELIKYWFYNITDLLELDFARYLQSLPKDKEYPVFGYKSRCFGNGLGVYAIIGSDHGGGKSRYLIRLNYESSTLRRKYAKVDYGTRTLQIAEVDCKRDVLAVQKKLAPMINEANDKLQKSKLVAVQLNQKIICKLVPKNCTNLRTEYISEIDKLVLKYTSNGQQFIDELPTNSKEIMSIWTCIPNFKVLIAGDLCFYATSSGRDGRSHCRCTYCDSSPSCWSDTTTSHRILTHECLYKLGKLYVDSSHLKNKPDTKGIIMPPLLTNQPIDYVVPLLHLEIGLVNKGWTSFCHFLDEFVENVSIHEAKLKDEKIELENAITYLNDEIDINTVNKNMALEVIAGQNNEEDDSAAKDSYKKSTLLFKELSGLKKKKLAKLRLVKGDIDIERKKRKGDEGSIEDLLDNILESCTIKKQHFHGGAMNGVCCQRLLDNVDEIFKRIVS